MLHINHRAHDQRIQFGKVFLRMRLPQHQMRARFFNLVQRSGKIFLFLLITDPDLRAAQQKQLRRRNAAACHAEYHRLLNHCLLPPIQSQFMNRR